MLYIHPCFQEFKLLKSKAKVKQTDNWKKGKLGPFLDKIKKGLDISTNDDKYLTKMEIVYGVKMTEEDKEFRDDQVSGSRKMYCESFADKQWLARVERRRKEEERMLVNREKDVAHQANVLTRVAIPEDMEDFEMDEYPPLDNDFEVEDNSDKEEAIRKTKKRRKSGEKEKMALSFADMPSDCQHIRHSVKQVRAEYYTTVDELISVYHMSYEQAISAVVTVGRRMFGLDWRRFEEGEEITIDTVPDRKMNRKMGKALEAFTLSEIVNLMLEQQDLTTVTYHDDGSRSKGAGGYSVQGLTIKCKFYPLPTLAISSETRKNLADLKLTVLQLLSVTSGVSVEALWEKIDFVMGDGTAHNLGVEEIVANKLELEHLPGHLLCQVHPALMFGRELVAVWKELDTTIGPEKIFAHFSVSLSDQQDSITEQWISCLLRLVTHDYDHKAWNRADEFDVFIHPDTNPAKRLIKERFNSLVYSCAVTLALDSKVTDFLAKYTNVTNTLACIVRSFESVEYLRILAAVGVILGTHLVEPYLSLTSSTTTTWDKLRSAFPILYQDLTTVKPALLLDLTKPAFKFVSEERFTRCLYSSDLLQPTVLIIEQFRTEIISVLNILLPKLAKGWTRQRGQIFGFGDTSPSDSTLSKLDQEKLKSAPTSNLDSERSVGSINHELSMRGAKELKAASSSHVKSKGLSLIVDKKMDKKFIKMTEKGGDVPAILEQWEEKQKELRKAGMEVKEIANLSTDKQRNSDLEKLTTMGGPFTSPEMVEIFMAKDDMEEKEKGKRLYLEVRHAKNSSISFPKVSELFRLKKGHKNLANESYAQNLMTYLKRISCHIDMDMGDFREALDKLKK